MSYTDEDLIESDGYSNGNMRVGINTREEKSVKKMRKSKRKEEDNFCSYACGMIRCNCFNTKFYGYLKSKNILLNVI